MKINLNLYIRDEELFLRKPKDGSAYALDDGRHMDGSWWFVSEVEFDVNVDTGEMIKSVAADIDIQISELHTAIQVAEVRKAELLALPAPS